MIFLVSIIDTKEAVVIPLRDENSVLMMRSLHIEDLINY